MEHPRSEPYTPTVRHFHNQLELQARTAKQGVHHSNGNFVVMLRWCIFIWMAALGPAGNTVKQDGCVFPPRWAGRWFQSGVLQPILIEGDRLSNKGKCLSSEGDKFIIVDEKGCHRCVVMHEKHINVLQYKETFCHPRELLPLLCTLITGDALLYSMFRENAAAVPCPLKAPFSFTYNRGHGDCKNPVSSIESCTEESRLLLNYQACPDVHGSESTVEELECLATWKEGSLRFLVGKVHHNHATSNEDRYRCFVYEKTNSIASPAVVKEPGDGVEYRVAQSGDATCNGLFSATEGSRTMALKRVSVNFKCRFPSWMTFSAHWHTLDFSSNYSFHQKNATLRISNQTGVEVKVHCVNIKASSPSGNSVALIAHWQHHCVSRYVCVVMYRRDAYIAELQRGVPTARADEACAPHHFNAMTAPYVTLVASNPESKECPYSGKYEITGIRHHQRSVRSTPERHASWTSEAPQRSVPMQRRKRKHESDESKHNRRIEVEGSSVQYSERYNFNVRNHSSNPLLRSKRADGQTEAINCPSDNYNTLEVGCNAVKNMEFRSACGNKDIVTAYTCHGGWYEDGTSFLITTPLARDSTSARRYCFLYRESRGALHFARSPVNCDRAAAAASAAQRAPLADGTLFFNATNIGECQDTSNNQPQTRMSTRTLILSMMLTLNYILIPR